MWLLGFLCTFLGLFIGGTIAWFFKGLQQRVDILYGLCAGIIFGLISFEIFPEAVELGGWVSTLLGFTIGMIIFEVLHNSLHSNEVEKSTEADNLYIRTSLLLIFSISIHNIPMGFTLGANQESDFTIALLQTVLFHSIPEGLILFTPLILAGKRIHFSFIFLITFLVSIPVALGIFMGDFLGVVHQSINTILIGITLGIICMVTISEILFPAFIRSSVFKVLLWTVLGMGILGVYMKVI